MKYAGMDKFIATVIEALIEYADNNKLNRDDVIEYFTILFTTMVEVSTFEYYTPETP